MIETVELDDYNKVPLSPGRGDVQNTVIAGLVPLPADDRQVFIASLDTRIPSGSGFHIPLVY